MSRGKVCSPIHDRRRTFIPILLPVPLPVLVPIQNQTQSQSIATIAQLQSVPAFLPGRASVGLRSFGKVADDQQGSAERSVHFDCLTPPRASQIIVEKTGDTIWVCFQSNEERWMMPTAVKMEVSAETITRAVKSMKKSARRVFMEDLIAATSPEYLQSIRGARRDFKTGRMKSHGEVFQR